MKKYLLLVWFYIFQLVGFAQQSDSLATSAGLRKHKPLTLIVPATLILTGTVTMLDKDADEFFLSNLETREERNEHLLNFSNHFDDYLQHAPSATVFILGLSGVKGKNDLPNQLALYLKYLC
jgi:hypothetical protein